MPPIPPSPASQKRAASLCARLQPLVARALEALRQEGVKFDDIEREGAAVGDLLARTVMLEAVQQQAPPTEAEVAAARKEALRKAQPEVAAQVRPEDLEAVRMRDRPCELTTARGPVPYARTYLYFPGLQTGVFPPRPKTGRP